MSEVKHLQSLEVILKISVKNWGKAAEILLVQFFTMVFAKKFCSKDRLKMVENRFAWDIFLYIDFFRQVGKDLKNKMAEKKTQIIFQISVSPFINHQTNITSFTYNLTRDTYPNINYQLFVGPTSWNFVWPELP